MFRILFLILFNLSFIQTFFGQEFSNTTPQSIMDNGTVTTYNLQVSGLLNDTLRPSFGVESVMININHKKLSELAIYLKAPNGIMTALSVYSGGNDTFFKNTFFKNTANLTLMQGFGDYSDTFKPEHSLAVFNRHTVIPNGQWQIMIYDNKPFVNTGKINNAIIKFSTQAAQPFLFTTSSLPILSLHTDGIVITTDPKIKISYYTIDNPSKINSLADTALKSRSKMLIEIRGNSSSGPNSPKKGFLIRSIKDDGSDSNINLFGLPKEHDFILNNFFGDVTFTKDVMSYDMYRKLGRWSPRTRYFELFINNDYRGVYCVFEKIKRDKSRVDIAKLKATDTTGIELTGGYIFKNDWTDPGDVTFTTPQSSRTYVMHQPDSTPLTQKNYIQAFMRKVDSTLISYKNFSDTINGYRNFIEYKSFIDYIILQEMSLGGDSYIGSTYFYKDKDTLNYTSKVNFGPPWDFNYSWARSFSYGKRLRITTINPWKELFTDTFFLTENWCRWNDLRGNIYSYNSISKYLDSIPKALSKEIYRDYERWPLASTSPMQFYGNITNG